MNHASPQKPNYQLLLEKILREISQSGHRPRLLLHACCAPCSSYVLDYLSAYFDITLYFYNPNISPAEEYTFRARELARLIREMPLSGPVSLIVADYAPEEFEAIAKGLENLPEGGSRCAGCYRLRLSKAADYAKEHGFDYFTTTLSISPYKNALWLNTIGQEEGARAQVPYLLSDFKKRDGYRHSCALSEEYGLYRQNFCGCVYSKRS